MAGTATDIENAYLAPRQEFRQFFVDEDMTDEPPWGRHAVSFVGPAAAKQGRFHGNSWASQVTPEIAYQITNTVRGRKAKVAVKFRHIHPSGSNIRLALEISDGEINEINLYKTSLIRWTSFERSPCTSPPSGETNTGATDMFLPYGKQSIDEDDIAAVAEVLRSAFLTTGPAVDAFETALAEKMAVPHAVACMNGTAALHMAAAALGIGPGDVVIVPAITFSATANGPAMAGAEVVFADIDPETGLLSASALEDALDRAKAVGRPRAVFPVHLNGQCVPMADIAGIAEENGLLVVEDACHAIGGTIPGRDGSETPVGSCEWSDAATFSFHPVKTIAMGEGGAVTTRNDAVANRLRLLRNHGITRNPDAFTDRDAAFGADGSVNPWYYEMQILGHNYRAPDINCALGLSQLKKLDRFAEIRRRLVAAYDKRIPSLAPLVRPITQVANQNQVRHLYVVRIDFRAAGLPRG